MVGDILNLEKLEKMRQELYQKKKENRRVILITVLVLVLVIILFIFIFKPMSFYGMIPSFFGLLPIVIIIISIIGIRQNINMAPLYKEYYKAYKEYFVKKQLESTFDDVSYDWSQGLSYKYLSDTKMIYMGDRYHSEDLVTGRYKNVNFKCADVHIEEERETEDSDGNKTTYYVTVFLGQWLVFDFNKSFKSNVQVAQKYFRGNRHGNYLFSEEKYKRVKLESEEFNKNFAVFAQNEHDAFYILTPSLMEKIMDLSKSNKSPILLCFINNELHIGLESNQNLFEPPNLKKTINENEIANELSNEIKSITMFIDQLQLDNDLFKKE